MMQFSFARSPFVVNHLPTPQDNPVSHLLPPEPIAYKNIRNSNVQSIQYSEENSKTGYVEITLGNSPEFTRNFDPPKPTKSITNFNKKISQSYKKSVNTGPHQSEVEVHIIPETNSRSRSKQLHSTMNHEQLFSEPKQKLFPAPSTEGRNFRQKQSRASKNTLQEGQSSRFVNSNRNPRQESLYAGEQVKKKFTNRLDKTSPENNKKLMETIEEMMIRTVDLQNTNKTLLAQLQIARQKLRVRQSQNNLLKSKNKEYEEAMDECRQNMEMRQKLDGQITHLKEMNLEFCEEIDALKQQIILNEEKKEQSLKLLQELNQNIMKREQKLQKELQEQLATNHQLKGQKQELALLLNNTNAEIAKLQNEISKLQDRSRQLEETISRQKQENEKFKEIIEQKKGVEAENQLLKKRIEDLTYQLRESENRVTNLIVQLRFKSQECIKLNEDLVLLTNQKLNEFKRFERQKLEWNNQMTKKNAEIEQLRFKIKQLSLRIEYMTQEIKKRDQEIKQLKEEKRILFCEKEEAKNDCNNLLKRNDELLGELQNAKHREMQHKQVIADLQINIIELQQKISQLIKKIAMNQQEIKRLKQSLQLEKYKNSKLTQEIQMKTKIIINLQQQIQKQIKISAIYKQGLTRLQQKTDLQWKNMTEVYNQQIKDLQQKIKQLLEYNDMKSKLFNKKSLKGGKSVSDTSRDISRQGQIENINAYHFGQQEGTMNDLTSIPQQGVQITYQQ